MKVNINDLKVQVKEKEDLIQQAQEVANESKKQLQEFKAKVNITVI